MRVSLRSGPDGDLFIAMEFVEGDTVTAEVDPAWRRGATQGHSGTHMVHAALRQVLGPNAVQAGSLNRPGYLRFDFNFQGALSDEQRAELASCTSFAELHARLSAQSDVDAAEAAQASVGTRLNLTSAAELEEAEMLALDASVDIVGDTPRSIPIADLFVGPKVDPKREHSLAPGELLLRITIPAATTPRSSAYAVAKEKQSHDWPLAEAAVSLSLESGVIKDPRIVLGHVAPIPWRSREAEAVLAGQKPSAELFQRAAAAALAPARPLRHNAYKLPLAQGLLREALHRATNLPLPE